MAEGRTRVVAALRASAPGIRRGAAARGLGATDRPGTRGAEEPVRVTRGGPWSPTHRPE
jgi:hypothetical protein